MNPEESSPVYALLRNPSMVDFEGEVAGVFFVSGCNFRCGYCHNAPLMGTRQAGLPWSQLSDACLRFTENWVTGAVVTGGEPTLAPELPELVAFLKSFDWSLKLDTNGSQPEVVAHLMDEVDYFAMDVKCSLVTYPRLTGYERVEDIVATANDIRNRARDYEFRTTIIEGFHTDREMHDIGRFIEGARRYILQPFVPKDNLPDPAFRKRRRTSPDRLQELATLMEPYVEEVLIRGG